MSTTKLTLELESENSEHTVTLDELEAWISEVKRHYDAANVDVILYVGCLKVQR